MDNRIINMDFQATGTAPSEVPDTIDRPFGQGTNYITIEAGSKFPLRMVRDSMVNMFAHPERIQINRLSVG